MGIDTKNTKQADIGLILEGTYPYVRGGVSSWIHQLISGLPELSFALMFIGDKPESYPNRQYDLPENVIGLSHIYVIKTTKNASPTARKGHKEAFNQLRKMYYFFRENQEKAGENIALGELVRHIYLLKNLNFSDFLYSEEAWKFITERYEHNASESSFLDYFWTIRAMHSPIFSLIDGLDNALDAKVYHTISTGYAGLYGVMLHHLKGRPLMLTEHGIYTKERKIDLSQVDWIEDAEEVFGQSKVGEFSYLRRLWIRFFETIGKTVYDVANPIVSISEINKSRQILDGSTEEKITVISNAVNLEKFQTQRLKRADKPATIIGFIARVVPIKDVKTFIRCMSTVCAEMPEAQAWIIGGEDEDPEYAEECRDMISSLGLTEQMIYKGFCNVAEILPQLGCVVLSSISEGVPLVIMEAFASGIPVISTDVGACRELIEGGSKEDRALGIAGAVVPIADSEGLATEIVKLLKETDYWQQCCAVAEKRADRYFDEKNLFNQYRKIYQKILEQ